MKITNKNGSKIKKDTFYYSKIIEILTIYKYLLLLLSPPTTKDMSTTVCTVPDCKICSKASKYAKYNERGIYNYVIFKDVGIDKSLSQCCLVKCLPNYPDLSPKDRCNPALLAYVFVLKPDNARIIPGPEPHIVAFNKYEGVEAFDDRAMELMNKIEDLEKRIAQLESALQFYYS